jgi:hypothetical protein
MSLARRLTAIGFALGSAAHTTGWVLLWWGIAWYGPGYPASRHVAMACFDASIAWIAIRRPAWLVFALAAFLAEQVWANGVHVKTIGELVVVSVAALFAAWERWGSRFE